MSRTPDPESPRITGYQWLVFVVASAGWVFDVYEGQLFTIFKGPALTELLGDSLSGPELAAQLEWQGSLAMAIFLVGGAVGGLGFGILADRIGRLPVLSLTILTYSLFSALTALVWEVWQLHALRFVVALGTGGEWAVAAALVAETFPTRFRALAGGTFHASSVLGAGLAAVTGWALSDPQAWRWGFVLGLVPALLVLAIRLGMREPSRSPGGSSSAPRGGSLVELLGDPRWRFRAWLGLALAAVGLGTYWGIYAWGPELVKEVVRGQVSDTVAQQRSSTVYLLMNFTGGMLGLLAFAPLATWKGRRFAFAAYHLGALVLAPLTFLGAQTYGQAALLLPLMAFVVLGMHAGYAIYFPELFPAHLRATGSSFCFNVGRLVGAIVLVVRGAIGAELGLRWAAVALSGLFLVGLVLLAFAPETRDQPLEDEAPEP
jgi:predicted MFS family arabinose efflux permease